MQTGDDIARKSANCERTARLDIDKPRGINPVTTKYYDRRYVYYIILQIPTYIWLSTGFGRELPIGTTNTYYTYYTRYIFR